MSNNSFQEQYNSLFDRKWRVKNYKKAFPLLLFAAKHGYAHAQNLVGYAYSLGIGTNREPKQAVKWFKRAVLQGDVEAMYNLALHYENGDGVSKDHAKALPTLQTCSFAGACFVRVQLGREVRRRTRNKGELPLGP
jgi:uncharacterized protein